MAVCVAVGIVNAAQPSTAQCAAGQHSDSLIQNISLYSNSSSLTMWYEGLELLASNM